MRLKPKPLADEIGHNSQALTKVRTRDLLPHPDHPAVFSEADIKRAAPVVSRFADRVMPVMVDDENRILVGSLYVAAAKRAGIKSIVVTRQSGLSDSEGLLLGVAFSKVNNLGSWDGAALEKALQIFETTVEDFSSCLTGFAPGELDRIIGTSVIGPSGDLIPTLQTHAVSWPGVIWECGDSRLLCGDATSPETVRALMAGETVRVAICDPPFGCKVNNFVAKKGSHREFVEGSGDKTDAELLLFFRRFCLAMLSSLMPGALIYLFIDWRSLRLLQQAAEEVFGKLINLCVWAKDRAGMGSFYRSQHELVLVFAAPGASPINNVELGRHGRDRSNLWSWPSASSSRKGREGDMLKNHPTPKPVEMIVEAIIDSSMRGDIVFDGFLGSGTTLIAAERSERRFRGMDMDPLYVDLAVRRWQEWTGRDAIDTISGRTFNDIAAEKSHA